MRSVEEIFTSFSVITIRDNEILASYKKKDPHSKGLTSPDQKLAPLIFHRLIDGTLWPRNVGPFACELFFGMKRLLES